MLRRGRFEEAGTAATPFPQTEGDGDDRIDGEGRSNLRPWRDSFRSSEKFRGEKKEVQGVARSTASRLRPSSDLGVFKESEEGTAVNPFPFTPWPGEVRGDDGVESKFRPAELRGKIQKKQKKTERLRGDPGEKKRVAAAAGEEEGLGHAGASASDLYRRGGAVGAATWIVPVHRDGIFAAAPLPYDDDEAQERPMGREGWVVGGLAVLAGLPPHAVFENI